MLIHVRMQIADPTRSFTYVGKIITKKFAAVPIYLSCQRHWCQNFNFFLQYLEIIWKNYFLALHLVEMDKDPDPDPTGSGSTTLVIRYRYYLTKHRYRRRWYSFPSGTADRIFLAQIYQAYLERGSPSMK
jgi:hypothetical protein